MPDACSAFILYTLFQCWLLLPLYSNQLLLLGCCWYRRVKIIKFTSYVFNVCMICSLKAQGIVKKNSSSPHCSVWIFLTGKFRKPPAHSFYITFSFGQYFLDFDKISKTFTQCKNYNCKMSNFFLSSRGF